MLLEDLPPTNSHDRECINLELAHLGVWGRCCFSRAIVEQTQINHPGFILNRCLALSHPRVYPSAAVYTPSCYSTCTVQYSTVRYGTVRYGTHLHIGTFSRSGSGKAACHWTRWLSPAVKCSTAQRRQCFSDWCQLDSTTMFPRPAQHHHRCGVEQRCGAQQRPRADY
jgi:hypothetical protein